MYKRKGILKYIDEKVTDMNCLKGAKVLDTPDLFR